MSSFKQGTLPSARGLRGKKQPGTDLEENRNEETFRSFTLEKADDIAISNENPLWLDDNMDGEHFPDPMSETFSQMLYGMPKHAPPLNPMTQSELMTSDANGQREPQQNNGFRIKDTTSSYRNFFQRGSSVDKNANIPLKKLITPSGRIQFLKPGALTSRAQNVQQNTHTHETAAPVPPLVRFLNQHIYKNQEINVKIGAKVGLGESPINAGHLDEKRQFSTSRHNECPSFEDPYDMGASQPLLSPRGLITKEKHHIAGAVKGVKIDLKHGGEIEWGTVTPKASGLTPKHTVSIKQLNAVQFQSPIILKNDSIPRIKLANK